MRKMWLGQEIVVAGLPPLIHQCVSYVEREREILAIRAVVRRTLKHKSAHPLTSKQTNQRTD